MHGRSHQTIANKGGGGGRTDNKILRFRFQMTPPTHLWNHDWAACDDQQRLPQDDWEKQPTPNQ